MAREAVCRGARKSPQPTGSAGSGDEPPAERTGTGGRPAVLSRKLVGQPAATKVIVPYIQMFQAGLAPEGRPVGVFLLLGPTGTGKTKTVEALAEILHGSEKNLLKVDCGEFQMEHEVAKLIGAPPGISGASRNAADADAAEAERGDQRTQQPVAGAVR